MNAIADRSPTGRDKGTLGSVHESGGAGTAIAQRSAMTRYLTTICAWSGRLMALAIMVVALSEGFQLGLDAWQRRKEL